MLEDIAVLTGGTVISQEVGLELKEATMDMLGRAKTVKVQKENTIIVDGMGDPNAIKGSCCSDQNADQVRRLLSSIRRSCRSVWLSWPAA